MTTAPTVGTHVQFDMRTLPSGTRQKLGSASGGVVTQVTWNGRIAVQPTGSVGVVWVEAIDIKEAHA